MRRRAASNRIELHATGLIDAQQAAIDLLARCAQRRGARKVVSCLGKAMGCRRDLGVNQRRAKRLVYACELRGERFQTIERVQVAEKLRRQILVIDNRLRSAGKAWVLRKPCPGATARAFQVDRGDLAVGCARQIRLG
jgi:hypothetical protein